MVTRPNRIKMYKNERDKERERKREKEIQELHSNGQSSDTQTRFTNCLTVARSNPHQLNDIHIEKKKTNTKRRIRR